MTLVNGVATFSGLSYNKAETMNIGFTTNAGSFTTTSTNVVVSPAAASQLVVTTQPSATATAGVAFGTQPVVVEEDQFGNIITTDSTHTVTAARGTDGTASLQGSPLTVTLVNGVATFSGLSYNMAETMNIAFSTNAGSFTATSTDVVVSPAAASQLVVTTQPSTTATAGVAFATQPVVAEEDQFGNIITSDSTHTVTAARGTDGTASLQGSPLTVTLVNGVATFSGLSYNMAETMNIAFSTNAGSFTTTSTDVVVSPAAASQLVVTTQPSTTATAGVAFATQPVVTEEDPFGNVITSDSTHTVTAARGNHGTASLQGSASDGDAVERRGDVQRPVVQHGRDDEYRLQHQRRCVHGDIHRCAGQPGGGQPVGGDDAAVELRHGRRGLRHPAGGGGRGPVRQHHHQRQHAHRDGGAGH